MYFENGSNIYPIFYLRLYLFLGQTKMFTIDRWCNKLFYILFCRDCTGIVLPDTFLVDLQKDINQPWRCNVCDNALTAQGVQNILERIGHDLEAMQKGDPKSCQLFLDYYGKILHHNHYYLTDVRLALSQLIGQEVEDGLQMVTDDELELKLKSCKEIIDISKTLNPGQ